MITLGVYAADSGCAAVVVDRGQVLSAVDSPRQRRGLEPGDSPFGCIEQALCLSNISSEQLDRIFVATESGADPLGPRGERVDPLLAHAAQLRAVTPDSTVVVVLEGHRSGKGAAVLLNGRDVQCLRPLVGASDMLLLAATVAAALGADSEQPLLALERLAGTGSPATEARLAATLGSRPGSTLCVDIGAVEQLIADEQAACPAPLDAVETVHIAVQRARGALAAAVLERIADVIAEVALEARSDTGADHVGFSGSAFASTLLASRVKHRVGAALFAPVAEPIGAALGAALLHHDIVLPMTHLALGPSFSEHDVKATLENCRLDYVYEPDWSKLHIRVSDLLATGALVGWFQGSLEFSPHSRGSRSILCDPSSRYTRENVNVFLLHRDVHAPLPLSLAEAAWDQPPGESASLRFELVNAQQLPWREKVLAAISSRGDCLVHAGDDATLPELRHLIEIHRARTGVPGLINVPMMTSGRLTITPREAVREAFGSAVDALVIGRFLVSKDYWLLRSRRS